VGTNPKTHMNDSNAPKIFVKKDGRERWFGADENSIDEPPPREPFRAAGAARRVENRWGPTGFEQPPARRADERRVLGVARRHRFYIVPLRDLDSNQRVTFGSSKELLQRESWVGVVQCPLTFGVPHTLPHMREG
jgi:hypothetical protein